MATKKSKGAPSWALLPFERMFDEVEDLHKVIDASAHGIGMVRAAPNAIRVLRETSTEDEKSERYSVEEEKRLQELADIAAREGESGFPLLYSFGTIMLWSFLEAAIRSLLVAFVSNKRNAYKTPEIGKIKVRFEEISGVSKHERVQFLVDQFESTVSQGLRYGPKRFEAMLKPIGYGGTLEPRVAKGLFELAQVRNLLLHRNGIFDSTFNKRCPWKKGEIGKRIAITRRDFQIYYYAVMAYSVEIVCRIKERSGINMEKHRENVLGMASEIEI